MTNVRYFPSGNVDNATKRRVLTAFAESPCNAREAGQRVGMDKAYGALVRRTVAVLKDLGYLRSHGTDRYHLTQLGAYWLEFAEIVDGPEGAA